MTSRILFLLVAYRNVEQVAKFVEHLRALDYRDTFEVSICDNSPDEQQGLLQELSCYVTARPDNPGYLEGALEAMRHYKRCGGSMPDWIVVTNTDLTFVNGGSFSSLEDRDPSEAVVYAPRISEPHGVEKNPHLLVPRSGWRNEVDKWLTSTQSLSRAYLLGSIVLQRARRARNCWSPRPQSVAETVMYAAYGAIMIFSRQFFSQISFPMNVPLLAEEYVVAELARTIDAPIRYLPEIHATHTPHSTTGGRVSASRARLLRRAFSYIDAWHHAALL
jgi:GT2 family glycosyltransferase